MDEYLIEYIEGSISAVESVRAMIPSIQKAADCIATCLTSGGTVYFAGNGGSAADAQHLAAELMGRFDFERAPLKAICLNTDTSLLTAIANDYGYDSVFSRQIHGHAARGDVAVLISTSGESPNIVAALKAAHEIGVRTIGLTGSPESMLAKECDIALAVGTFATSHVQEAHGAIGHAMCGYVEQSLFPQSQ
ncbi:MAG: SIS domain-containing protein [Actinomycetota bacterium]|nr:SIS domain-containing protein [Actinomycetota bacterium]